MADAPYTVAEDEDPFWPGWQFVTPAGITVTVTPSTDKDEDAEQAEALARAFAQLAPNV